MLTENRSKFFSRNRIEFSGPLLGLPGIGEIGRINFTKTMGPLKPQRHANGFEVYYLATGKQVYTVEKKEYPLSGGDLFFTLPNEWHGTGKFPEEKSVVYWVRFELEEKGQRLLGLSAKETAEIRKGLFSFRKRPFRGAGPLKKILDEILLTLADKKTPYRMPLLKTRLLDFLLHVLEAGKKHGKEGQSQPIGNTLNYINAHIREPLSSQFLAKRLGLSLSWFNVRFKKEVGIPPADYVLGKKIGQAVMRLKGGEKNITNLSFDLGFSSSQYFATVFKRFTGKKPSEYKGKKP